MTKQQQHYHAQLIKEMLEKQGLKNPQHIETATRLLEEMMEVIPRMGMLLTVEATLSGKEYTDADCWMKIIEAAANVLPQITQIIHKEFRDDKTSGTQA